MTTIAESRVKQEAIVDHQPDSIRVLKWKEVELHLEERQKAVWVKLKAQNRPSFTPSMLSDLLSAFQWTMHQCANVKEKQALPIKYVITSSLTPGMFNMGGDLPLFKSAILSHDRAFLQRYAHLCIENQYLRAVNFHLPIVNITLLEGDALGGGFECALADDILIAEKGVKMGFPEVKFNLYPGMGAYTFLSRKLEFAKTKELITSGQILTAEEWHELGVVDVLAEKGEGEAAVRAFIEKTNRSFESFQAIQQAGRIANPITREELIEITDIWVDTVFRMSEWDIRKMSRIADAQDRKFANIQTNGGEANPKISAKEKSQVSKEHNGQKDHYVIANTDEEAKRLSHQADIFGAQTRQILERIGLSAGMRCLDVGCGSGDVMRLMGQKVGKQGYVTGLDINQELGQKVIASLQGSIDSQFDFVQGSIEESNESLSPESFDIVYARFLVLHLQNPVQGIKNMWKYIKPGGHLVLVDFDFRTMDVDPPDPMIDEFVNIVTGVLDKAGLDPRRGHKLPGLMEQAGVGHPDAVDVSAGIQQVRVVSHVLRATYSGFLPKALKLGVTTQEKADEFFQALDQLEERQSLHFMMPLVVGAWKQK